jgi:two-component system phosphate regulon sensor histidine kinase PhoR
MRLGIRGRLFGSAIVLTLAAFIASGLQLHRELEDALSPEQLRRIDWLFVVITIVGLMSAIAVAAIASHLMSRMLRDLMNNVRAITRGRSRRIEISGEHDLARLAGSLNEMAEELDARVSALASERARFEAVLEGMNEAVIALDDNRSITLMNDAAHRLLRINEDQTGRSVVELIRVPALQELFTADDRKGLASVEFELPGTERRVLASRTSQKGGGGVLVLHDITDLRRLETIRRDFVANVSHELRTPVSVIRANLETLLDGALEDKTHGPQLAQAALRSAERLKNIIDDLLDLSRLEAGRYDLRPEGVSIRDIAERAAGDIERYIINEVPADQAVLADPKAVEQILINLLDNAAKYTPFDAEIRMTARLHRERLRIEVRDTGPGIEPRHRSRVFERFYRVDPGRSREKGGTGLGLAIVKHLVEAMDGRVGVEANDPRGSIFWFDLPVPRPKGDAHGRA